MEESTGKESSTIHSLLGLKDGVFTYGEQKQLSGDVFIVDEHRGKGYSSLLIANMMNEPILKNIQIWRLATTDAHFLYRKFGFTELKHPEKMMEKKL